VAYLLKARTVKPEKQPLLGNGCVISNNGVYVGSGFSVWSVPRLYTEYQLPLQGSRETAVRREGSWCHMNTRLRGREPGSKGTSTGEDTADRRISTCCSELKSV
jgi:hypothetical protein